MTTHPSIPPAPAGDSEFTARMAEIRERLEAAPDMMHVTDVTIVGLTDEGSAYAAYMDLLRAAPTDLAYLLDGLTAMQAQRDAARAEAAQLRAAIRSAAKDLAMTANWDTPGAGAVVMSVRWALADALKHTPLADARGAALAVLGEATLTLQRAKEAKAKAGRMTIRFSEEGRAAFADDQRRYDAILTTLFEAEKAFHAALRALDELPL